MRRAPALLAFVVSALLAQAQTTSSLTGTITDATTQQALPGATVEVLLGDSSTACTTDSAGRYRFAALPTGIHSVRVRFQGHGAVTVPEVWIRSGRTEVLDVGLPRLAHELREVEVEADAPHPLATIGSHTLTVEQSLRYPASFFDPARLASTRPGVAATDDQANHMSVRGNGPASNAYLLEGAEIVNPNHLTNAGTASDQPTLSGGGVSILSAQMLGNSQLLTGGFGAAYGNAVGGILDINLRRGTAERQAFTAQAGLLGIDLSTEGPFKKGGNASYLVNYRYSTVGLLSAMGVDLGDEVITFQDLSFHVSVPMKRGSISLFGLGGMSSNRHDALEDSTTWEFDKDSQNITYEARMGAAGGTIRLLVGRKAVWTTTAVISENDQTRDAEEVSPSGDISFSERSDLAEMKLSAVSRVQGRCGEGFSYLAGASVLQRIVQARGEFNEIVSGWLLRPYAQGGYALGEHGQLELGMAYAHYTFNNSGVAEPRATFQWRLGARSSFGVSAGQRSQLPAVQNFMVGPIAGLLDNTHIGLVRSQDVTLAFDHAFKEHLVLHGEVFHQRLMDVAVTDTSSSYDAPVRGISLVNVWDRHLNIGLAQQGDGTNTGAELSLQHLFHEELFYQVNLTVFNSDYTDANGTSFQTRWNTNYIANLMVGREFERQKEKLKRTWGVSGRAYVIGGQRYTPIPAGAEVVEPYSAQLATYYRIDLRIYLKREHGRRTGMWALDLQNATNAQNEAYRYFDTRKNEVVTKYQLGLIPNLSYRIEF